MTIPDKLPIMRMEDYHTHHLGKCSDGRLFWGYDTFVFTKPYSDIKGDDWGKYRKEYALRYCRCSNKTTRRGRCFLPPTTRIKSLTFCPRAFRK